MAAYVHNPNLKPLPPPGGYTHLQHQQQNQLQHQLQLQQQQQQQQNYHLSPQQDGLSAAQRPGSFVGLPPIRRASTFSSSLGLTPEGGFLPSEGSNGNGSGNGDGALNHNQQQQSQHPAVSAQNPMASGQGQFAGVAPQGQFQQSVYRPTQAPAQSQIQGPSWGQPQPPPAPSSYFNAASIGAGFARPGPPPQSGQGPIQAPPRQLPSQTPGFNPQGVNGAQLPSQSQQFMGANGRPVRLPPHMAPPGAAANSVPRFQPQGGWDLQESHLSAPLQQSNRHRSTPSNASSQQQPSYGYDKETGLPLDSASSSPQRQRAPQPAPPPQSQPQPNQQSQLYQQQQQQHQQQQQQHQSTPPLGSPNRQNTMPGQQSPASQQTQPDGLSRIRSNSNDMSAPDDARSGRRDSGIFSGFQNRMGGGIPEERSETGSTAAGRFQGQGATGDAVSETSILTEEMAVQKRRNPLFAMRGNQPGSDHSLGYPGGPPSDRGQTSPQFAPPERKRTGFFGLGGGGGTPQQQQPSRLGPVPPTMSRTSTSSNVTESFQAGNMAGAPKKRFSNVKDFFHRSDANKHPGPAFSIKSSTTGQFPSPTPPSGFAPGPNPNAPPPGAAPPPGPERVVTGLRQPGIGMQQPTQQQPQPQPEKKQGGLFGFLKKGPETKAQQAPPGQNPAMMANQGRQQYGPGQGMTPPAQFPGQFGSPIPTGYDGRPLQGGQPGQFGPQSQFMQPSMPGAQQNAAQTPPQRPGFLVSQQSPERPGQFQGMQQQPNGQMAGFRPALPSEQSETAFQNQPEDRPFRAQQPSPAPQLQLPETVLTPFQETVKLSDSTASGSDTPVLDSPVSQGSQPLTLPTIEQSRFFNASPVSSTQVATDVQPSPVQSTPIQSIRTQGAPAPAQAPAPGPASATATGPAPPSQMPARKPLQSTVKVSGQFAPLPSTDEDAGEPERPRNIPPSRPLHGPPAAAVGAHSRKISASQVERPFPGGYLQAAENRTPSRHSIMTVPSGGQQPQQSAQQPGPSGYALQDPGPAGAAIPRPPSQGSQLSQQSQVRPGLGAQGQGPNPQQSWIASQNTTPASSPQPPRQQFGPPGPAPNRQNGVPFHAAPREKEQSTISKLFKGSKTQGPAAAPVQEKQEKEKKGNLFGAFKRAPKSAAESTAAAVPPQAQGPPPQGPPGQPFVPGQPLFRGTTGGPLPQQQQQQQQQQQSGLRQVSGAGPAMGPPAGPGSLQPRATGPPAPGPGQPVPGSLRPQPPSAPTQSAQQAQPTQLRPGPPGQPPQPGPLAPNQAQQQGPPSRPVRPPQEGQYEEVPIPAGYQVVHGAGRPDLGGFYAGGVSNGAMYGLPAAQMFPPGFVPQQWAAGGLVAPGAAPMQINGVPAPAPASGGPQPTPVIGAPAQVTPPPQQAQASTPASAPTPGTAPGTQPNRDAKEESEAERQPREAPKPTPPTTLAVPPPQTQQVSPLSSTPSPAPARTSEPPRAPQPTIALHAEPPRPQPPAQRAEVRPVPTEAPQTMASPPPSQQLQKPQQPPSLQIRSSPVASFAVTNSPPPAQPPSRQLPQIPPGRSPTPGNKGPGQDVQPGPGPMQSRGPTSAPSFTTSAAPPAAASAPAAPSFTSQSPVQQRVVSPEPPRSGPATIVYNNKPTSPERTAPASSPSRGQLQTPTGNVSEDNIYDATPRQSTFPPPQQQQQQQQQQQPSAPSPPATVVTSTPSPAPAPAPAEQNKLAPPPQDIARSVTPDGGHTDEYDTDSDLESPIIQSATLATVSQPTSAKETGPPAKTSVAIFERAKRKAEEQRELERRRDLEEKIVVDFADPTGEAGGTAKTDEEVVPHMSATSYPGQEWNPYGDGGFEDWNEPL